MPSSASLLLLVLLPGLSLAQRGQGQDGNPHNWDRRRRCDQTEYRPACGICEGVGGIAFGDDNQDITLARCVPVTTNVSDPVKPNWGDRFTANHCHTFSRFPFAPVTGSEKRIPNKNADHGKA